MSVVYFLVLVGVLVSIHELGHLAAAKMLDFRVLRFSIGFGRPLVRLRGRETEYQLALIPLGGYVRLLGEDPGDDVDGPDAHRAWAAKPIWQRSLVVLAGPAANLALPIVLYFAAFAGHHELTSSVVGDVVPGSPAAQSGLEAGDRVVSADGDDVRYWEDLEAEIEASPARALPIQVERRGQKVALSLSPATGADGRGQAGVVAAPFLPQVAVLDAASPAARAGLATGDLITAIDGARIRRWSELERALTGRRLGLSYLRGQRIDTLGIQLLSPHHTTLSPDVRSDASTGQREIVHGLHPASMVLAEVATDGAAATAGLRVGDRITAIDGARVDHWLPLSRTLAQRGTAQIAIDYLRAGPDGVVPGQARVRQRVRQGVDEYGQRSSALELGARPAFVPGRVESVEIDGPLFYAAGKSVERTFETIRAVASGLGSMIRGHDPEEDLGGPITMFRAAAVSASKGLEAFLLMLALVSVSVGLLNLLPVPTLDGGQLALFAIEALWRRPLSLRTRDRIAWVGLAMVGLITILALRNDVMRYVL